MLIYTSTIGQKNHTFMCLLIWKVGEYFDGWPQAWSEGNRPFTRKQRHHRHRDERETHRDRERGNIKYPGMTEAPS